MERPSFGELKAALELPFRTSLSKPPEPPSYIVGIHIQGVFFPDLWIKFSPHCNVMIGVKGTGKTSVLECLRFALGAAVPESRKETVRAHLESILGPSGKVRVLVKRQDGAKLLVDRSLASPHFGVTFSDDRTETFTNPEAIQFPAYVLGWHEIEQAATDVNIRRLYMDTIAGREEVRRLEDEAKTLANNVRHKHDVASNRYGTYKDVHEQVRNLEELRKGLQNLTDANLVALKSEYEAAIEHHEQFPTASQHLNDALAGLGDSISSILPGLDRNVFTGDSPLSDVTANAKKVVDGLFGGIDKFDTATREQLTASIQTIEQLRVEAEKLFEQFAKDYEQRTASLTLEERRLLDSHRGVTEKTKALPRLSADLASKKTDVENRLAELAGLCGQVADRIRARAALRQKRVAEFNTQVTEYGVRLSVEAHLQPYEYADLARRYSQGWEIVGRLPTAPLMHDRLKGAYQDLLRDLAKGNPVFFSHAEFGYFLDVFENDDLKIEFDVTATGDGFRPIDQLSAGQRCTAVFPVLLKLQAGPLVVDQPEDNLDNRHIANSIAPALLDDKRFRQVILTSHNANLVVLNDAELVIAFESTGSEGWVESQGFLATRDSAITRHVLEILDGGQRALEMRYRKYGGM
jgi:DNA repair ATPase RecN